MSNEPEDDFAGPSSYTKEELEIAHRVIPEMISLITNNGTIDQRMWSLILVLMMSVFLNLQAAKMSLSDEEFYERSANLLSRYLEEVGKALKYHREKTRGFQALFPEDENPSSPAPKPKVN